VARRQLAAACLSKSTVAVLTSNASAISAREVAFLREAQATTIRRRARGSGWGSAA
jgi:hypothetical protein